MTIKLVKSLIGSKKNQIATAHALGLKKIGDVTTQPDNAQTKGPVKVIRARRLVQAAASVPDLRAVRCLYSVVSLKEVSTTFLQKL